MSIIDNLNVLQENIATAKETLVTNLNAKGLSVSTADSLTNLAESVTDIPQEGGGGYDWSAIGYDESPELFNNIYDYSKNIYDNWDSSTTNMDNYFKNDGELIIFPKIDTSNVTSMSGMCSSCSGLKEVPVLNTSKVTNLDGTFSYCNGLNRKNIENWDVSSVTSMDSTFTGIYSSEPLNLSNWDVSNVTNMRNMFSVNPKISSLDLSNWDTSKVTNMSGMFSTCGRENPDFEFNVGHLNTSSVTKMQWTFNGTMISTLDISGWDTSKVTHMNNMFDSCSNLGSVEWPDNFGSACTDMSWMFYNCTSLEHMDCSKWDVSKNTRWIETFPNTISSMNYFKKTGTYCVRLNQLQLHNYLTSIDFSGWDMSNVTHLSGLCSGATALTEVTFGSALSTASASKMDQMFYNCSGLTSLNLGFMPVGNVTSTYQMFYGCKSLTDLNLDNWMFTDSLTNISFMFYICSGLTSLDLSLWDDVSNVTTCQSMFAGCKGLTSLNLSEWNLSSVTTLDSMFSNCTSLVSLDLSGWYINPTLTRYTDLFYNCNNLTEIKMIGCDEATITKITNMKPDNAVIITE